MIFMKKIGIIIFSALLLLTGCSATKEPDKYISFSITRNKSDGLSLISEVYYAGLNDKEATLVGEIESKAQYTAVIYDKKRDTIYYAEKAKDRHADEVYAYDCKTQKSKQLTDDFYAINYLFLKENELVIVAIPKEDYVLKLFTMDLETLEVTCRSVDPDFQVWAVSYDPTDDTLFIGGYSASEHRYRISHQDIKDYVPCANTFYLIDKDYNWNELWISPEVELGFNICKLRDKLYFKLRNDSTDKHSLVTYHTDLEFSIIEEGHKFPYKTSTPIYTENDVLYYIEGGSSQAYATYNEKTDETTRIHCNGLMSNRYGNARIVFQ